MRLAQFPPPLTPACLKNALHDFNRVSFRHLKLSTTFTFSTAKGELHPLVIGHSLNSRLFNLGAVHGLDKLAKDADT